MPSVNELSTRYDAIMVTPRRGVGVCTECFNTTRGHGRCYHCCGAEPVLDLLVPISYSVAHEQLHQALAGYKRLPDLPARRYVRELAAILWRFLAEHEACVAQAAQAGRFELVTTVPSSDPERDERHPLRQIVAEFVAPTRGRYQRLLVTPRLGLPPRTFDPNRFEPVRPLDGEPVLLIDDTWTTGANARSAAAALKRAGAGRVAAVVIGRHLNREWHDNDARLRAMSRPFDWSGCALCAGADRRSDEARGTRAA
jgi:predicted amidophosphoribosyltransferase